MHVSNPPIEPCSTAPRKREPGRTALRIGASGSFALACALTFSIISAATTIADELSLRNETKSRNGTTLEVSQAGVMFQTGSDPAVLFSWDRVRDLKTEIPGLRNKYQQMRFFADDLWRARTRIEREDYGLAEPLLKKHFKAVIGRNDPSARVVAEGLLRCRLSRQAREQAVLPWLETARMIRAGIEISAYSKMTPILDANSGLCPDLPPVWIEGPDLESMVAGLGTYFPTDAPVTRTLAKLYLESARRELIRWGMATSSENTPSPDSDAGEPDDSQITFNRQTDPASSVAVSFVGAFLDATTPDKSESIRNTAVKRLTRWIADPDWKGAWAHYARGSARLQSPRTEDQDRGLVDLLYLPSEYVESERYLAGFAIQHAIQHLKSRGRTEAADSLRNDFEKRFADHPLNRPPRRVANKDNAAEGNG